MYEMLKLKKWENYVKINGRASLAVQSVPRLVFN